VEFEADGGSEIFDDAVWPNAAGAAKRQATAMGEISKRIFTINLLKKPDGGGHS
jgi:hypothetical protein